MFDIKKHWTTILGVVFFLTAFVYLLAMTIDDSWFTPSVKIVLGLVGSLAFLGLGYVLINKKRLTVGQLLAGSGTAMLMTTYSFAGVYYDMWSSFAVFAASLITVVGVSYYSFKFNLRALMNVGIAGALMAPIILRPETDQVFTLFLYALVINAAYFFVATKKSWAELYAIAFAGTWAIYTVYMVHFDPATDKFFSNPVLYAIAAFIFYVAAFNWNAIVSGKKLSPINVYLSVVNPIVFSAWTINSLSNALSTSSAAGYTLLMVGSAYVVVAAVLYVKERKVSDYSLINLYGGLIGSLIAVSQIVQDFEYKVTILVLIWTAVAALLLASSKQFNKPYLATSANLIWLATAVYWGITTWDTPRGEWFGQYIPFLNTGAMAWVLLAVVGFYIASSFKQSKKPKSDYEEDYSSLLSYGYALASHLIVGGLLTVQIQNVWEEYLLDASYEPLALSVSWGIYAFLLVLWGAYRNQILFKVFGSIVLVFVGVKTIFFDLAGNETFYKVFVLLALGLISFAITYVNGKFSPKSSNRAPEVEASKETN